LRRAFGRVTNGNRDARRVSHGAVAAAAAEPRALEAAPERGARAGARPLARRSPRARRRRGAARRNVVATRVGPSGVTLELLRVLGDDGRALLDEALLPDPTRRREMF